MNLAAVSHRGATLSSNSVTCLFLNVRGHGPTGHCCIGANDPLLELQSCKACGKKFHFICWSMVRGAMDDMGDDNCGCNSRDSSSSSSSSSSTTTTTTTTTPETALSRATDSHSSLPSNHFAKDPSLSTTLTVKDGPSIASAVAIPLCFQPLKSPGITTRGNQGVLAPRFADLSERIFTASEQMFMARELLGQTNY
jgi:hypothetical protein